MSVRRQRPMRDKPDARAVHKRRSRIAGLREPPAAGRGRPLRDLRMLEPDRAGVDSITTAVIPGGDPARTRSRDQEVGKAGDVLIRQGRGGAAVPDSLDMRCLPVGGPAIHSDVHE
eukprot:SAG22_NODE_772_length_7314_cov_14.698545_2_plen_116_part_00